MTTSLETTLGAPPSKGSLRTVLVSIIGVAVLVVAVGAGFLWGASGNDGRAIPNANSVDAGFARDMATHHQQAVTMAGYARDNSTNIDVKTLAFDIETSQSVEMGEMIGWLQQWNVSRVTNSPMKWMQGHTFHIGVNGLMPGMATPAQMDKLLASHGHELDILFLQLMIHHHQGGVLMAQYAAQHAVEPYVRTIAAKMYVNQTNEIVEMERLLRQLGGAPLPPPVD
ncbi:MAG TPA: DUF305 domain-containing protein [Jatrophihabitantaceae bacterium]|jgi:uncharacterized protein (DUF305 family)|nr:DUF305 domain-containing protein [Jatrophihabitantaceae bacterium]